MQNQVNSQRRKTGYDVKKSLRDVLLELKSKGHIKLVEYDYTNGYPDKDSKQFKFDFLIKFNDDSSWIIKTTNSIRSDRVKGVEFDAEHLKKLNSEIEAAYLVCPDKNALNPEEMKHKVNTSKKIRLGIRHSSLNNVLYYNELTTLIKNKSQSNIASIATLQSAKISYETKSRKPYKSLPSQRAKDGLKFEELITNILNNKENWTTWNSGFDLGETTSIEYRWFFDILNTSGFISPEDGNTIIDIKATDKINKLPNKGLPKTDVAAEIFTLHGTYNLNISCKNTNSEAVSVHQYPAQEFIKVLGIDDPQVITSLNLLQDCGGPTRLKNKFPNNYTILEAVLPQYNKPLIEWVYFGIGGQGKGNQIANFIVTYIPSKQMFSVYNKEEFVEKQIKIRKQFNTPFIWTHASKQRGKSIQLKGSTI